MRQGIWRVAVASPLRRAFDYLPPHEGGSEAPAPGVRLRVPFGRSTRIGVLLDVVKESELPLERLKRVGEIIDPEPVIDAGCLGFLKWAADYYHYPVGEVVLGALPLKVRRGGPLPEQGEGYWRLSAEGRAADAKALARAPRQRRLFEMLRASPEGVSEARLSEAGRGWRAPMRALSARGWVVRELKPPCAPAAAATETPHPLNPGQQNAVEEVMAAAAGFAPFVLNGITGSGKTEVYLELIQRLESRGRQALVLIPEIGLTPQIVARFRARLDAEVVVIHSGLTEAERLGAWLAARDGRASVIIGTRSAVFAPLARPGLVIVDEEHDPSYKQQEGFRYSARDLAVVRARMCGVPIVLGSATPSLETVHNVATGRYSELTLPSRAAGASPPQLDVIDLRGRALHSGLSEPLLDALRACIEDGEQAILFINRRGFAPAYLCRDCGWVAECRRCDAGMVFHRQDDVLLCHHCGSRRSPPPVCPQCGESGFYYKGLGTERVVETLAERIPHARIRRVDRDSTRRKGAFDALLDAMHRGEIDIVVGTQMVAKGHHFPNVTLVGVVDADTGLFGVDFRSGERMAQLLLQVSGRAGRGERPGRVMIQTHHPEHPLLKALLQEGYGAFAHNALDERAEAGLPPFAHMTLLRAQAPDEEACETFLNAARSAAEPHAGKAITLLGPVPAPMPRRAGRYRAQLFVEAGARAALHRFLNAWTPGLERLPQARRVRWSLDVDPQEIL